MYFNGYADGKSTHPPISAAWPAVPKFNGWASAGTFAASGALGMPITAMTEPSTSVSEKSIFNLPKDTLKWLDV